MSIKTSTLMNPINNYFTFGKNQVIFIKVKIILDIYKKILYNKYIRREERNFYYKKGDCFYDWIDIG